MNYVNLSEGHVTHWQDAKTTFANNALPYLYYALEPLAGGVDRINEIALASIKGSKTLIN